ncbi:MAG: SHOCT domain-containing protein [Thaumarchaeota archaeon]|nr:SHOCT domain-containing protein [Nitrososphaerota archaeon]
MFRAIFSPFRWLWIIIGVLVLSAVIVGLVSFASYVFLGHPLFAFGGFFPFFWFGPFFGFGWIIFIFLIIGFGARFLFRPWRRWGYYGGHGYYSDPAMQALRERYARGEITKEQFESMASDLERHHSSN